MKTWNQAFGQHWASSVLAIVTVLALAGCSTTQGGDTTAATDAPAATEVPSDQFVVRQSFADLQNPAYITMRGLVEEAFVSEGVDYVATDSMQDPSKQLDDMETFVSQGVDLIIVDPVDEEAIVPGIEAANEAGIPVFLLIKSPSGGEWVSRIYIDQVNHAYVACQFLASQLDAGDTVAQLQGIMSIQGYRERSDGCVMALEEAGIEIVAQQEGKGERTESLNVMEAILQVHPDVKGVFGANDEEALGAVEAFKAAGIDPSTRVIVGIDGTEVALESMCQGELSATVADLSVDYSNQIFTTSMSILRGEEVPAEQELEGRLTTSENLLEVAQLAGYEIGPCPAG